jgi:hypothetical protein
MHPGCFAPLVRALEDYHRGHREATVVVWRDDGLAEPLPVAFFFRGGADFSALEHAALDACRGRVLNAEAAAGAHSLALQARGHAVRSLTYGEASARVLSERGLADSRCGAVGDEPGGAFDTVLKLAPGVGLAGDLEAVAAFLAACRARLAPRGRIVVYSRDMVRSDSPLHVVYGLTNRKAGRLSGEVRVHLEYAGERGPAFRWLHVDAGTLSLLAVELDLACEIAAQDEHGRYVAVLR